MLYFNIFIPILSICLNVAAQIFFCKYIVKRMLLKSIYVGFIFGLVNFILCEFIVYHKFREEWFPLLCVNLIIYGCLSGCYFTFINMSETARRVRLLRELYEAADGLTKEGILKRYNAQEIIDVRTSRLLNNGQIILREGKYYIGSPLMAFISRTIVFMKFIMLGKEGEL